MMENNVNYNSRGKEVNYKENKYSPAVAAV